MAPLQNTYFEVLGLERRYHLAARDIEERYHAAARQLHPDRHVKSDARTRVSSALRTAELTAAYRALKDPVKRAEYLLELEGLRISDEKAGYKPASTFLVEILELREGLEEARASGDQAAVARLGAEVRERDATARADVDQLFQSYDAGDREVLPSIAEALIARRYYRRFLDELEAHEEAQAESAAQTPGASMKEGNK